MQITNGTVEYEHPYKVADFQIPKAKVTLSFVIPEGEDPDAAIASVGLMARLHAHRIAGAPRPADVPAVPPTPAPAPAAATRTRKTPPIVAPAATVPADTPASVSEAAEPEAEKLDLFDDPIPAALAEPDTSAASDTGDTQQALSVDASLLSDGALKQAAAKKIEHAADRQAFTNKLRDLIFEYTQDRALPISTVTDMAKRAEYYTRLQTL